MNEALIISKLTALSVTNTGGRKVSGQYYHPSVVDRLIS